MDKQMELLAALQRDIEERLKPVRGGMSDKAFDELVRDIAAVKLKYGIDAEQAAALLQRMKDHQQGEEGKARANST